MLKFAFSIILISSSSFVISESQRHTENRGLNRKNQDSSQESSEEFRNSDFKIHSLSPSITNNQDSARGSLDFKEDYRRNRVNNDKFTESTNNRRLSHEHRAPLSISENSNKDTIRKNIFWETTTEKPSYREISIDTNSFAVDRNETSFGENETRYSASENRNIIMPDTYESRSTNNYKENTAEPKDTPDHSSFITKNDNGALNSKSNRKSFRRKKQRLCEQKYTEYMTRIFNDDDTVEDGIDSEFDGRVLAEPGEYPHMTALGFTAPDQPIDYKCGGSLISENFVLTAAHCTNLTGQAPKRVRIGDLNLMIEERYLEPQIRNISRIYRHPEYRSHLYYNDIALLQLEEPVEFTEFVRPIRLWIDTEIPVNITAHAMGYGATAFGKARTNRLTDMNLTIVPNDDCNRDMPDMPETPLGIISSQICARDYLMNRDTCQGDSGGPLQLNLRGRRRQNRKHYHLIGITSYGLFCRSSHPSVYTRVSEFLDWIEQIVWLTQL